MIIKPAKINDIEKIADCLENYYINYNIKQNKIYNYDRTVLVNSLFSAISGNNCFFLLVIDEDKVVGLLWGFVKCNFYSKDYLGCIEIFYIEEKYRSLKLSNKLMKIFFKFCERLDCKNIEFAVTSGLKHEKFDKYLKKLGFNDIGNFYNKEI